MSLFDSFHYLSDQRLIRVSMNSGGDNPIVAK